MQIISTVKNTNNLIFSSYKRDVIARRTHDDARERSAKQEFRSIHHRSTTTPYKVGSYIIVHYVEL